MSFSHELYEQYENLFQDTGDGSGDGLSEKWGPILTIDSLADGNILLWEQVSNLPIRQIYTKLMLEKDKGELERLRQLSK